MHKITAIIIDGKASSSIGFKVAWRPIKLAPSPGDLRDYFPVGKFSKCNSERFKKKLREEKKR